MWATLSEQPPWAGVGIALPSVDALGNGSPVVEVARAAEQAGLDHVWVPDHLVFHRPVLEATIVLACVAGATERVRLGTAILNPTLRPVVWLAKHLSTLGALAPDRLLLGVGLGGEYEPEFRAAGIDPCTRGRRLDEALQLLPRLMAGDAVVHSGLFEIDCEGLAPPIAAFPPLLIGGRGEAAIRRAWRFGDAWFPMWLDPDEVASSTTQLTDAAAEHGRAVPGVALVAFVNVCEDRAVGEAQAAELIRRQYGMPFDRVRRWTLIGGPEQIAERLSEYRAAGVQGFCLAPAHPRPLEQVEAIAAVREQLAPAGMAR
jgi:alkanesulfonate monooxygenase SsuD/methylene tetrahydromethanopterin reductase-like flavin-dependent oxidoreductase (luciferase family)